MMGRPPLPTHIKLVQGTARPHRLNPNEPKPPLAVPEPPTHLTEQEKAKFISMAEMLVRRGVMTELDAGALARYATAWCRWVDAEAEIKKRGLVVKTSADFVIQNPFLAVANRCMNQMAQIESEFGLTPSARTRIRMEELTGEIDPFEEYLRGGKQLDLWHTEKT
jgi:P27 family predicted phage terminase small subunit